MTWLTAVLAVLGSAFQWMTGTRNLNQAPDVKKGAEAQNEAQAVAAETKAVVDVQKAPDTSSQQKELDVVRKNVSEV